MSLVAGARLGPYEILSPIGAGGMGEVYRSKDTRLDREVAIKIPSGKEIYFIAEGKLMAASVRLDRVFECGPPAAPFAVDFVGDPGYEAAPDGRFLLRADIPGSRRPGIQIIANWASELKQ